MQFSGYKHVAVDNFALLSWKSTTCKWVIRAPNAFSKGLNVPKSAKQCIEQTRKPRICYIRFVFLDHHLIIFGILLYVSILWQYGLWSFQTGYTKLERFLPKNQHTQRKLLNFENWVNGLMG